MIPSWPASPLPHHLVATTCGSSCAWFSSCDSLCSKVPGSWHRRQQFSCHSPHIGLYYYYYYYCHHCCCSHCQLMARMALGTKLVVLERLGQERKRWWKVMMEVKRRTEAG